MMQLESPPADAKPPGLVHAPPRKRGWPKMALRLGVSGLTLVVLFLIVPRDQLWDALRRVPPGAVAAGVAIYLTLHLLGIMKWRLTINLAGASIGFVQAARCYYGGLFATIFLPSILGGDVVRAGLAFGRARSRMGLVLGSLLDRLVDFTALAFVAALGALLLLPEQFEMVGRKVLLPLAAAFVVGVVLLAALWFFLPARRLPFKVRRRLVTLRAAMRPVVRRPHIMLASLALGITLQGSLVFLNAWLGGYCGLDKALAVWFVVWPLAKLSAVLPITQGGMGVREGALAALFVTFDVPLELGFAVGLVFWAVVFTGGLLSGPMAVALSYVPHARAESPGTGRHRAKRGGQVANQLAWPPENSTDVNANCELS
jgi:uncharacterized membrane protein YbhN (UPF0104 family)